jgi:hypothetical protein
MTQSAPPLDQPPAGPAPSSEGDGVYLDRDQPVLRGDARPLRLEDVPDLRHLSAQRRSSPAHWGPGCFACCC